MIVHAFKVKGPYLIPNDLILIDTAQVLNVMFSKRVVGLKYSDFRWGGTFATRIYKDLSGQFNFCNPNTLVDRPCHSEDRPIKYLGAKTSTRVPGHSE